MAVVGHIARAHGIRGQVIVNAETDFPRERFCPGAELFGKRAGGPHPVETLVVTSLRFHRDRPVIGLDGVHDMTAASAFAGTELRVPVERLATLPEGTFYRHELVGCAVETGQGERIGVVTGVESGAGGSRLLVATPRGEVQVPMVAQMCLAVEPSAKRIVVALPEGLLDL